jgi:hypothetical protein
VKVRRFGFQEQIFSTLTPTLTYLFGARSKASDGIGLGMGYGIVLIPLINLLIAL